MHILLVVLKIIGILLAILLILFGMVLLVPVHYKIKGKAEDEQQLDVHASWLLFLRIESFLLIQKRKLSKKIVKIKLFGICIYQYPKDENKRSRRFRRKKKPGNKKQKENRKQDNLNSQRHVSGEKQDGACEDEINKEIEAFENTAKQTSDLDATNEVHPVNDENHQKVKKRKLFKPGLIDKIKRFIQELIEKIKLIWKNIAHFKDMLYDESNRSAVLHLWKELKFLLNHLRPRKVSADLRFGLGDPARTGEVLGVLCMFPIIYRYDMHLVPDFETESFYAKGEISMSGYARIIHLVRIAIRLWKDKNIRKLIKK